MKMLTLGVLAFVLVACGGGSSGTGYDNAKAVATAAGCTSWHGQSPEMYAADAGSCRFHGHSQTVQWFKDGNSMDQWNKAVQQMGAGEMMLRGSNWVIECNQKADCDALKDKLGGTEG